MRLLLDTHVWLWAALEPKRLGRKTRDLLTDPAHRLHLSAASAWEVVLKAKSGKLQLPADPVEYVRTRLRMLQTPILPIDLEHVLATGTLQRFHRDPFDRIIIAQSFVEGIPIVTADRQFNAYPIAVHDAYA